MTTQAVPQHQGGRLRAQVAEDVRIALVRKRLTGAGLARLLNRDQTWVSRRLRGLVPFDVDDLEQIADVLEVEVSVLLRGTPTVAKVAQAATVRRLHAVPTPTHVSLRPHSSPPLLHVVTAAE